MSTTDIEEELAQSQAHVKHLQERLDDLTEKLQQSSSDGDEQGDKINAATEAVRTEHANKMRDMSSANQARLDHLRMIHREELDELRTQHDEEVAELTKNRDDEAVKRNAEVESLREQTKTLTDQLADAETRNGQLEQLQLKYKALEKDRSEEDVELKQLRAKVQEIAVQTTEAEGKDREISRLQAEIARLSTELHVGESSQSKAEVDSEAASSKDLHKELEQLRAEHESRLNETHKSHSLRVAGLETKHDEDAQHTRRDLESLRATLAERDGELDDLRKRHAEDLDRMAKDIAVQVDASKQAEHVQHELEQKNAELTNAKDRIGGLEKSITSLQQHIETSKTRSSHETRELQQQIDHKNAEVEKQAETVKQLQQLMQYKAEKHEKVVDDLNATHAERLKQLENDGLASLASLEAIETSNNMRIEKLQAEHVEQKENALTKLRDEHVETSAKLQEQVEVVQKQINHTTSNHQTDLDQLQSVHKSSQERALQALRDEHAGKVKELEEKIAAHTNSEAMENQYKQQVEQLETQMRTLSSQAQNASFQVQTMRHVIRSNEEEAKNRIDELEAELESTQGQFSQAVVRISQNSYQMSQLQAELQRARTAQETEHEEAIADLKREHEKELSKQIEEVEQKLRTEHGKAVDDLKKQVQSREHELRSTVEAHQMNLSSLQLSHEDALSRLQDGHATELARSKAELEAAANTNRDDLIKTHQDQSKRLQDELADLKADLDTARANMSDTSAIDQVEEQLRSVRQELGTARSEHTEVLKKLRSEHHETVENLKDQLSKLQVVVETPLDMSRETGLQAELASTNKKLTEMAESHDRLLSDPKMQYEAVLKQVQSELDNVRSGVQPGRNAEFAAMESTIREMTDANAAMSEQIDELKSTIEQLNQVPEAQGRRSDTTESDQRLATVQTRGAKVLEGTSTDKPSPKGGLASSKWATFEESSMTDENEVDTEREDTHPLRRSSVHGQLASINEDIRSLNNLSEQMLAQNRLMARTLSRVDAYTGVVTRT